MLNLFLKKKKKHETAPRYSRYFGPFLVNYLQDRNGNETLGNPIAKTLDRRTGID
jgi:hypothetical protein